MKIVKLKNAKKWQFFSGTNFGHSNFGHSGQWTVDSGQKPLGRISVGILKFFKTIVRPWQAGVLKNGPRYCKFQQLRNTKKRPQHIYDATHYNNKKRPDTAKRHCHRPRYNKCWNLEILRMQKIHKKSPTTPKPHTTISKKHPNTAKPKWPLPLKKRNR